MPYSSYEEVITEPVTLTPCKPIITTKSLNEIISPIPDTTSRQYLMDLKDKQDLARFCGVDLNTCEHNSGYFYGCKSTPRPNSFHMDIEYGPICRDCGQIIRGDLPFFIKNNFYDD